MMKVLLLLLFFVLVYGYELPAYPFSCMDGPMKGFYCSNDLSGYHDCSGKAASEVDKKPCPADTRCRCYINTICTATDRIPICDSIPEPPPVLPESFNYTYAEADLDLRRMKTMTEYEVNVMRNKELGLFATRIFDRIKKKGRFEYIIPENGKFALYEGSYLRGKAVPMPCMKTIIDKFPPYWKDYSLFTYHKENNGKLKSWSFAVGNRARNKTMHISIYFPVGKNYPTMMLSGDKETVKTRKTISFDGIKPPAESFKLPPGCI